MLYESDVVVPLNVCLVVEARDDALQVVPVLAQDGVLFLVLVVELAQLPQLLLAICGRAESSDAMREYKQTRKHMYITLTMFI